MCRYGKLAQSADQTLTVRVESIRGIRLPYRKLCSLCVTKRLEMEICAKEYLRTALGKVNFRSEKKTEILIFFF